MSKHSGKKAPDRITARILPLLPLIMVLAVIPLIFRLYQYDTGLQNYDFFANEGISSEFALHGKMVAFIAVSAAMLILILYKSIKNRRFAFDRTFIPLFIYGTAALLSAIFSKYQPYPFTGSFEQFEPVWCLLGYVVAAYYAYLYVNDEDDLKILVRALAAGAGILVLIGLTQIFDRDILSSGFGRWLTIPSKYYRQLSGDGNEFIRKFKIWRVFMTFSNPNYVGSYVPLISPVMLMAAFEAEKTREKIAYGAVYAGLIVCLFGSGSKTGFAGLIVSMVILAAYLLKTGRKKIILTAFTAFLLLLAVYIVFGNNDYLKRIKSVFNITETTYDVTGIETLEDGVRIVYKNKGLTVSFDPERLGFSCRDDSGEELYMSLNDKNRLTIDDPGYEGLTIRPVQLEDNLNGFEIYASRAWYFARRNGKYYYYTPYGKLIGHSISRSNAWLDRHGLIATGRGFLWSRTLPLIGRNIVIGSGPDTFVFEYPGADFVASYNSRNWGLVVTKPHCMYLQIAVQTGLVSLLAVLAYYVMFAAGSIKELKLSDPAVKDQTGGTCTGAGEKYAHGILLAILAGTAGYMTAAIFNDSSIAIAPLFWTLTGIGPAVAGFGRENKR
ncbi:MAG: O-antigen ligase family protein [Lachnospiraceae bacterium]|nr:O-antigen ligase family protein [Lachnospiraceae bacterium]